MSDGRSNAGLAAGLLMAVFLWGASNAGSKYLLESWPPLFAGATRFLAAGLAFRVVLGWSGWMRNRVSDRSGRRRDLWLRTGLSLAVYIAVFQWALRLIPVSRVALYLGAAPVWAILIEHGLKRDRRTLVLYAAALLALVGVAILVFPSLEAGWSSFPGELLGFSCGWLWAWYGRECRRLGRHMPGAEITASTMWRAGLLLMLPAMFELKPGAVPLTASLLGVQAYCVIGGGVAAYWLWNHALRCWPTSRVYVFNNLIPVSTTVWAHYALGEPVTPTLGLALGFIVAGVLVGQRAWVNMPAQAPAESPEPGSQRPTTI